MRHSSFQNGHIHTAVMAAKTRGCKQNAKVIVKEAAALGNALPSNMSRLALGDIGNIGAKVSGSTINGTKRTGAIKKEILNRQPLAFRQKSAAQSGSAAVKDGGRCSEFKISDCVVSDVDTCYKASALPKADSHEVQVGSFFMFYALCVWLIQLLVCFVKCVM